MPLVFRELTDDDRRLLTQAEIQCVELYSDPYQPKTQQQIADVRGTSKMAVSYILHRAKAKLTGRPTKRFRTSQSSRPVSLDSIDESQVIACA